MKDTDITERMSNILLGVHVKEFMLFYNEELQYYITENPRTRLVRQRYSPLSAI